MSDVNDLTHIDETGNALMVDISSKDVTLREATARGRVLMQSETLKLIVEGDIPKGDVLATARIAGIMAAKRTPDLIPLCHPLPLSAVKVHLEPATGIRDFGEAPSDQVSLEVEATVRTTSRTGVEMEALTAVSVAALTVYDMCKAVERTLQINDVRLIAKSGGRSGDYRADE